MKKEEERREVPFPFLSFLCAPFRSFPFKKGRVKKKKEEEESLIMRPMLFVDQHWVAFFFRSSSSDTRTMGRFADVVWYDLNGRIRNI